MATRITFLSGQDTLVTENESEVVAAVRRDHPNPVKLEGTDGVVQFVNWSHVTLITPTVDPPAPV
jgi:hypothetical protein